MQQPPTPQPKQLSLLPHEVQRRARILAASRMFGDEVAMSTFGITIQGLDRIRVDVSEGRDIATETATSEILRLSADDFRPQIADAMRECLAAAKEMAVQRFPSLDAAKACSGMIASLQKAWEGKKAFDELNNDGAGDPASSPQAPARHGRATPKPGGSQH